jgi:hypothetical protein
LLYRERARQNKQSELLKSNFTSILISILAVALESPLVVLEVGEISPCYIAVAITLGSPVWSESGEPATECGVKVEGDFPLRQQRHVL